MTDYYPIIERAVSSLGRTELDTRQALYERIRTILGTELRTLDPPLLGSDIVREMRALEAAIQRVEAEQSGSKEPLSVPPIPPASLPPGPPAPLPRAIRPGPEQAERQHNLRSRPINEVKIDGGLRKKERSAGKNRTDQFRQPKIYKKISARIPRVVKNVLKNFGATRLAMAGVAALAMFTVVYILGLAWLFEQALHYLMLPVIVALVLCVFVFAPMSLSSKWRVGAIYGFVISSYLFAIATWTMGTLVTLEFLGGAGVVVGLILGFVGVIPLGFIAAAMHADWSSAVILLISAFVTWGTRMLGFELGESVNSTTRAPEDTALWSTRWALFPGVMRAKPTTLRIEPEERIVPEEQYE
jgi:hypothetical protein